MAKISEDAIFGALMKEADTGDYATKEEVVKTLTLTRRLTPPISLFKGEGWGKGGYKKKDNA